MEYFKEWYPDKLNVSADGTPQTISALKQIYLPKEHFTYAEFGIYKADTARQVCEFFPNATLHLFDYENRIKSAKDKLKVFSNKVFYYSNSQRYNDSYNWNLGKICMTNRGKPLFDYCFLDGAHTFAIDALNFFLCDKLTRIGGFIDFDDYGWKIRGSSLDPIKVPAIKEQYTDEQIDSQQVALIIETLVKTDKRYKEIASNKIYQKLA